MSSVTDSNDRDVDRIEARMSVDISGARLREYGASAAPIRVENLSWHGFRTEWPHMLTVDDRVLLTLPGMEAKPATVRWVRGFQVGCQFDEALHSAVFEHVLKRLNRRG